MTSSHGDKETTKNGESSCIIKPISECYVKPKSLVDDAINQPYYLGPIDLMMLSIHPIQKGLLFPLPQSPTPSLTVPCLLEKLTNAISIALVHFYPLAGQLSTNKYEHEHACLIFVDCANGPGAKLTHACASNLFISDILSPLHVPLIVHSFFDLGHKKVNHDGHTNPLLSIQVTELLDGVFIGFTMNHSIVDGTSFLHFITSLSEIFQSKPISKIPIFKPFIPDEYSPILKLPFLEPEEFIKPDDPGPLKERIFHFSFDSIVKLKESANQDQCDQEVQNISSFQALCGLVWISIIKARNPARDQQTCCNLLINARSRLNPPLSDDYFGNFITFSRGLCSVDELLSRDLGWAARVLHQSIVGCDENKINEMLKIIADRRFPKPTDSNVQRQKHGPNSVVIGGSARFDMYGPEFGLGPALALRTGFANKEDGKVTANPGCEGGGSVDLEICLTSEGMDALEADEEFMKYVSLT